MQRNRPGNLLAGTAAMFPHTPNPIPSAAAPDLKYVQSQGTPLVSAVWGKSDNTETEAFALSWDAAERSWIAVYKMTVLVCTYVCTSRPLLALTLRSVHDHQGAQPSTVHHGVHHPSPQAPSSTALRKTPAALIDAAGGLKSGNDLTSRSDRYLQEVNLLEGIACSVVRVAFDADGFLVASCRSHLQ